MATTQENITMAQLAALRREAVEAGDAAQEALCELAERYVDFRRGLDGPAPGRQLDRAEAAAAECARVIRAARAAVDAAE